MQVQFGQQSLVALMAASKQKAGEVQPWVYESVPQRYAYAENVGQRLKQVKAALDAQNEVLQRLVTRA